MKEEPEPALSAHALMALDEFLQEQHQQKDLLSEGDINLFPENWQLSQFWYDDATATTLAEEILRMTCPTSKIGCISTPTVFCKLKVSEKPRMMERESFSCVYYE
jgi:hypothetical protein